MTTETISGSEAPQIKKRRLRPSGVAAVNPLALRIRDSWKLFAAQDMAFKAMCLYLFVEYVRPQQIFGAIYGFPLGQLVLGTAVLSYLLSGGFLRIRGANGWLLVLFTLVIVASSLMAFNPDESYKELRVWFSWVLIFLLIVNIVNTERRLVLFTLTWLLSNFYMSQGGAKQFALRGFTFTEYGIIGAPGWFQNSGEFGIAMCMLTAISWHFYVAAKPFLTKWRKVGVLLIPLTALLGVIGSSSRGAIVGLGAFLLYTLLRSKHRIRTLLGLAVVCAAVWIILPPEQKARFDTAGEDKTSVSRLVYWRIGLEMAQQNPLLGVGYNNWLAYYRARYSDMQQASYGIQVAHNIFVQCVAELGYVGLAVFVALILATLVTNHRTRKILSTRAGPTSNFALQMAYGLDGAMLAYLAAGSFVTVLYYPFFWINLAMTAALGAIVEDGARPMRAKRARVAPRTAASSSMLPNA